MPRYTVFPARLFRQEVENPELATGALCGVLEHRTAELIRILTSGARELVNEPFEHERIMGVVHRAPEAKTDSEVFVESGNPEVGNQVIRIGHGFCEERRPSRPAEGRRRRSHHIAFECDELAAGVHAAPEADRRSRTIEIVLDVFLAAPDELYRFAVGGLRSTHRLCYEVSLTPPPETTAQVLNMNLDPIRCNAEGLGRTGLRGLRVLGSAPDLATLVGYPGGAVHGLHTRMRQVWHLVCRLQAFRRAGETGFNIPVAASDDSRLCKTGMQLLRYLRAIEPRKLAEIVVHLHTLERFAGLPIGACDDDDSVLEGHSRLISRHAFAGTVIEGFELAAEGGAGFASSIQHVRQEHVDPEPRGAIDLVRNVGTRLRAADDRVLRHLFQRRVLRDRHAGGEPRDTAERALSATRRMDDETVIHGAVGGRHLPTVRHCLRQHDARCGTDPPQLGIPALHREASQRSLLTKQQKKKERNRRRVGDGQPLPATTQLLHDDHGQRGMAALAHLDSRSDDGDAIVLAVLLFFGWVFWCLFCCV